MLPPTAAEILNHRAIHVNASLWLDWHASDTDYAGDEDERPGREFKIDSIDAEQGILAVSRETPECKDAIPDQMLLAVGKMVIDGQMLEVTQSPDSHWKYAVFELLS